MSEAILLRTHRFGAREAAFLDQLARQTGWQAYILADETRSALAAANRPKISLNGRAIHQLGLRATRDMAWRCGDYGFYIARAALPDIDRFWMIEPDVRAGVADYGALFHLLATLTSDFMAPGVTASDRSHFWYPTMRWAVPAVHRCHFAFCAMTATAADLCLGERRRLARRWQSRIMWPNDETFVTSTLIAFGRKVEDINAIGRTLWTEASFGFFDPQRGEDFEALAPDGLLHHPVLWGAAYRAKAARIRRGINASEWLRLKVLRGMGRLSEHRMQPAH